MILPLIATLLLSPQPAPVDVGRDSDKSFAWDWDGTHEDGTPGAEVTRVEFRFIDPANPGNAPRLVTTAHTGTVGENRVPVRDALAGISAGIYDLQVRLLDPGGQSSDYSPVLQLRVRVKNPSAPKNVRVVLLYLPDSLGGCRSRTEAIS